MESVMLHLKNLVIIPILIVFLFLIPSIISLSNKNFLEKDINSEFVTTDLLLTFFSYENATLRMGMIKNKDSIYTKSMNLINDMTNIKMDNLQSYIENEIPGYRLPKVESKPEFHFTMESAPPLEVLQKERDLSVNNTQNQIQSQYANGTEQGEKIFIYHTHSWETYTPQTDTDEVAINITDVGEMLGKVLKEKGISAVVDKTNIGLELTKKGWQTNQSYQVSRNIVQTVMANNDDFKYFIDLHRDSARKNQTTITLNNKTYAKIVFVIGEENKQYEQNLTLAKTLHEFFDSYYPGVSKGILGKYGDGVDGVYNQDLSPNSLVIEVGGVDNNETEIRNTIEILADAIGQHYWKAIEVNAIN